MRGVIANGEQIMALRKAAGLTQEMLAIDSGCDTKTVRGAEHSKRVDVATLRRIANRLGVDLREIMSGAVREREGSNITIAENWIRACNARDPDALADRFTENGIVIVLADRSLPGAGEFRGKERISQWAQIGFEAFLTFLTEPLTEAMHQADAAGDFVFVRVEQPTLEHLPSGNRATVSVKWEFEIAGSRVTMFRVYPDRAPSNGWCFNRRPAGLFPRSGAGPKLEERPSASHVNGSHDGPRRTI